MLDWKKYYNLKNHKEIADEVGLKEDEVKAESCENEGLGKHLGWLAVKEKYEEKLCGLEFVELVEYEDGSKGLVIGVGYPMRYFDAEDDIKNCLGL